MNQLDFFIMFPGGGITSPDLLTSSCGEIDAKISLDMQEIYNKLGTNYFIKYAMTSFESIIKPKICTLSNQFKINWENISFDNTTDIERRIPFELMHIQYRWNARTKKYN